MKAKTFVACVLTASALPLAAIAQNADPSGPQGTGWYGAPSGAVAVPQTVPQTAQPADGYRRDMRGTDTRRPAGRNWVYQGPSWETNPPAPPA